MLVVSDVYVLITYSMIVESFFIMLSVSSVLYFRYTRPDMPRPIKVSEHTIDWFCDIRTKFAFFLTRSCR